MTNMFQAVRHIPKAEELIEVSLSRGSRAASRISVKVPRTVRNLRKEQARLKNTSNYLLQRLEGIVKQFPSLDRIHPFFFELASLLVDIDMVKQNLAAVDGATKIIHDLSIRANKDLSKNRSDDTRLRAVRREALGRIESVVKRLTSRLMQLEAARKKLRTIPSINPELPTIVIAGAPNTGKSTLVRAISTGKPEVASYPFTTKSIELGHIIPESYDELRLQIVDTPGLLDRPLTERNEIERQAITAIRFLATSIVFLIDPSETCGYSFPSQLNLLHSIKEGFPFIPLILAFNRTDLATPKQLQEASEQTKEFKPLLLVAETRHGTDQLLQMIIENVRTHTPGDSPLSTTH